MKTALYRIIQNNMEDETSKLSVSLREVTIACETCKSYSEWRGLESGNRVHGILQALTNQSQTFTLNLGQAFDYPWIAG